MTSLSNPNLSFLARFKGKTNLMTRRGPIEMLDKAGLKKDILNLR